MSDKKLVKILKKYQRTARQKKSRQKYFSSFEKKMIYRTTKTENPSTTMKMVNRVIKKSGQRA